MPPHYLMIGVGGLVSYAEKPEKCRSRAHVRSTDKRTDVKWWIVPFCKTHNNFRFTNEVFLDETIEMVSADKAYTCKR